MGSSFKLQNAQSQEFSITHNDNAGAISINSYDIARVNNTVLTGTSTIPTINSKNINHPYSTPITVTDWNYSTTTITLTVAGHSFVANDTIEVTGLTTTDTGTGATSTYVPNGVWVVTSVTGTTIVFTASVAPTVTNKSVSSATVKGITLVNGIYGSIGIGQTWQDMTSKRASGVTYTNTTGKPIAVAVSFLSVGGTSFTSITMYVDGVIIIQETSPSAGAVQINASGLIIVPNNSTYKVDVSSFTAGTLTYKELR